MAWRGTPLLLSRRGTARQVRTAGADADEVRCVFDNTAAGEGTADALALREMPREG